MPDLKLLATVQPGGSHRGRPFAGINFNRRKRRLKPKKYRPKCRKNKRRFALT